MAAPNQLESFINAGARMGGMHAQAWKGGVLQTDIFNVTMTITLNRVDIPLVGRTSVGHKVGRDSREGTMAVQKIDSRWELFIWEFLSQTLETRRAARGTPNAQLRTFDLKLVIDDPDAYGREAWQLYGCQIWHFVLGSAITDDSIEREYPITWDREEPIDAFEVKAGGQVVPRYVDSQKA